MLNVELQLLMILNYSKEGVQQLRIIFYYKGSFIYSAFLADYRHSYIVTVFLLLALAQLYF